MRVISREEAKFVDTKVTEFYGIPLLLLMENAGNGIARVLHEYCKGLRILILCGTGNNGGDGLVAARHLESMGHNVDVCVCGNPEKGSPLFTSQYEIADKMQLVLYSDYQDIDWSLYDVVVECLIGTGFHGTMKDGMYQLITVLDDAKEAYGFTTWAIDVPAGMDADTGDVAQCFTTYDHTITLGALKPGLVLKRGLAVAGQVHIVGLGLPFEKHLQQEPMFTLDESTLEKLWHGRNKTSHKGTNGHTLVIGGSDTMIGAPILVAEAAVHSGSGKTTLLVPESVKSTVQAKIIPEVMVDTYENMANYLSQVDTVVIGPGLGRSDYTKKIVEQVLATFTGPVTIDADGLYVFGEDSMTYGHRSIPAIVTPHVGEFSYMTGLSIGDIQSDPIQHARAFAMNRGVIMVLKDANTIIAIPNGTVYINVIGNEGMGTGGMGDVLSGVIGGFTSQIKYPVNGALWGVYAHSASADDLYKSKILGYTPSDVSRNIGRIVSGIMRK